MTTNTHSSKIPSFVRRKGRLSSAQERALEVLLPQFALVLTEDRTESLKQSLQTWAGDAPTILEIGFGNGDNLLKIAAENPHKRYIGVEVYLAGIASALLGIERESLENIRLVQGDAVTLLEKSILPNSLDQILILFPDPWHKKRHNKRRLIQPSFIALLARSLKVGGIVHMATDWQPYAEQMMLEMTHAPGFENPFGVGEYALSQLDRVETRFERRGVRLGHDVWDLVFRKSHP